MVLCIALYLQDDFIAGLHGFIMSVNSRKYYDTFVVSRKAKQNNSKSTLLFVTKSKTNIEAKASPDWVFTSEEQFVQKR